MITGNEPAMPHPNHEGRSGLSIRQQFAATAMQGLISKYYLKTPEDQDIISQLSVELADSLIKQLNKQS